MATTYNNVLRVFDTPANLSSGLDAGMFAYDTTNDRVAVKRLADSTMLYISDDTQQCLLTTNQTVAGIKTFSSFPVTPSSAPSTDYQAANKKYVDDQLTASDLDFAGDSGTGAVDLDSQSLTIAGTASEIETAAGSQTLTIGLPAAVAITTSLDIGSSIAVTGVLDEDDMVSDSAVKLCTQQSIKKYVDDQIGGSDTWAEILAGGNTSGANDVIIDSGQSLTVDTNTLVVNASGYADKVGIGTSTPSKKLTLETTLTLSADVLIAGTGGGSGILQLDRTSTSRLSGSIYSTAGVTDWYSGVPYNAGSPTSVWMVGSSVNEADAKLIINASGQLGLGTPTPDKALTIRAESSNAQFNFGRTTTAAGYVNMYTNSTGLYLQTSTDDISYNTLMTFLHGGNVGIGTGTPGAKVEILGDTNKSVQIGSTAGPFTTVTYFSDLVTLGSVINLSKPDNGNYAAALFTYDTTAGVSNNVGLCHGPGDSVIASDTLETMRIERGGDVGIGTASPGAKVEILGDTNKSVQIGSTAGPFTTVTYFSDLVTLGSVINLSKPDNGNYSAALFTYDTTAGVSNNVGLCHAAGDLVIASGDLETMRIERYGNVSLNGDLSLSSAAPTITLTDSGSVAPTTMDLDNNIFTITTPSGEISLTTPLASCSATFSVGTDLTVTGNDINDAAGAWLTSDGAGALRVNGSRFTVGEDFDSTASFNLYNDGSTMSGVAQTGLRVEQNFASGGSSQIFGQAIDLSTSITGTTTNLYSLYIDTLSKGASHTITTQYGLYINSVIGATNNYAIYTGTGKIWFNDDLLITNSGSIGVGTTTPDGSLNIVNGTILSVTASTSSNDLVIENGGDAGMSILAADAGTSQIAFGSPSGASGASIFWGYSSDKLKIITNKAGADIVLGTAIGTTALTLDSSQDATFTGDVTINGLSVSTSVFTDSSKKLISRSITDSDITRNRLAPSAMGVSSGSLTSGTLSSVQDWEDGTNVEIQETTGSPGINVIFTFASVDTFSSIAVSFHYDGSSSHSIDVEIYDDTNTTWRPLFTQKDIELNYDYRFCDFPGTVANYINSSEEVKIRFYHPSSGITSHDLFINYVSIVGETT